MREAWRRKKRRKKIITYTLAFICLIGIIYSSYSIIVWKININKNSKMKESLDEMININIDKENYTVDFEKLKKKNPDTVAYLEVKNTNIEYVIVKGENNKYYLNHSFNKEYNIAGWPFADYHNKLDETDRNIIIYGHNMQDGSMFETLKDTLTKKWYENEDNHEILLITEKDKYFYQVFSTYTIIPESYYITTSFSSDKEYLEFLKELKSRSVNKYDVDLSENDKILTLSSCTTDGKKRVVLHAKLINKED